MSQLLEEARRLNKDDFEEMAIHHYRFHLDKISQLEHQIRKHKISLGKLPEEIWQDKQNIIERQ